MSINLDDYRWLTSDAAATHLRDVHQQMDAGTNIVRIAKSLRKDVSAVRSALVLELVQLRARARKKFRRAQHMFFTKRGLEQSTGYMIGDYKAARFSKCSSVADICCSIGGDLISLANVTKTTGIDKDPLAILYAQKNLEVNELGNSLVQHSSFEEAELDGYDGIHIDPDRRAHGRTTHGDLFLPTLPQIVARLAKTNKAIGIKVAPATPYHECLPVQHEQEWIGNRRECKQQVIWLGASAVSPGRATATRVVRGGRSYQFQADKEMLQSPAAVAKSVGRYVYEPHSTVLAGAMTDAIAIHYGLRRLARDIVYLTGKRRVRDRMLRRFRVIEVLPLEIRKLEIRLNELKIGQLEIKNRGVPQYTVDNCKKFRLQGDDSAVLILTRQLLQQIAIITQRV